MERPAKRPSRAERSAQIKDDLFQAAAAVVGEVGYSDAMVATITARAKVAQGTFYNHFDSRQDLFDQLLPSLGIELLDFIRERVAGVADALERERLSFIAFFEFLVRRPAFYRILYEAELFAPRGYQEHMSRIAAAYVRTFERDVERGQLTLEKRCELEAVAYTLMGARHYLCMRFARQDGRMVELPGWVVETYMGLVTTGVFRHAKR